MKAGITSAFMFLVIWLFVQCSTSLESKDAASNVNGQRSTASISDRDWQVKAEDTTSGRGEFEANCSSSGECWYWNTSSLWAYSEQQVTRINVPFQPAEHLLDCFLIAPQVGWVVTDSRLLKTSDGGKSWVKLAGQLLESGKNKILSIWFSDERHGWAVGARYKPINNQVVPNNAVSDDRKQVLTGMVWLTLDGGLTWQTSLSSESVGRFNRIGFSGETGLVSGDAGLRATTDGGRTWRNILSPFVKRDPNEPPQVQDIFLLDVNHAWVTLSGGRLIHSDDGTQSWHEIPISVTGSSGDTSFSRVAFVSQSKGLALRSRLNEPQLYKTDDGGKTWFPVTKDSPFSDFRLIPGSRQLFAVGDNKVYRFSER